jgi:predicted transglutaminase-like protease
MICIACIVIIVAFMPVGYYFIGPISILMSSIMILYAGYKKTCSGNKCREVRR